MKQHTAKHYTLTSKTAKPTQLFLIKGTSCKIAIPYSIQTYQWGGGAEFDLFGYKLRVVSDPRSNRTGVVEPVGRSLPESWFVDLSGDVRLPVSEEVS